MSLVQCPSGQYRNGIKKGLFYHCPYTFSRDSIVLVRPLCDSSYTETIPADIIPITQCNDAFDHQPFDMLKLKGDEEFTLQKTKYRRVVATTTISSVGMVNVAPVFTLKDYHSKTYDMEKLKNNQLAGLIYLEEGAHNKSSFISLIESFPVYINLLAPIRLQLSTDGIMMLDDNIALIYDLYSTTST